MSVGKYPVMKVCGFIRSVKHAYCTLMNTGRSECMENSSVESYHYGHQRNWANVHDHNSEVAIFITGTYIDSFYQRKHIQTEQGCSQSRSDLTSEMTVH